MLFYRTVILKFCQNRIQNDHIYWTEFLNLSWAWTKKYNLHLRDFQIWDNGPVHCLKSMSLSHFLLLKTNSTFSQMISASLLLSPSFSLLLELAVLLICFLELSKLLFIGFFFFSNVFGTLHICLFMRKNRKFYFFVGRACSIWFQLGQTLLYVPESSQEIQHDPIWAQIWRETCKYLILHSVLYVR